MTEKQREVSVAVGEWRWGTNARSPVCAQARNFTGVARDRGAMLI